MTEIPVDLKEAGVSQIYKMKNLIELSGQEKDEIKDLLKKSHGTAQLWVHPPFEYEMDSLVRNSSENIPVIALIDSPRTSDPQGKKIEEYEKKCEGTKSRVYYVRTYSFDPTPCLDNGPKTPEKKKINWDKLAVLLKELGVRKVIVSGKNFFDEPIPNNRGCVGVAIHQLKERGIIPFQSIVTFPEVKTLKKAKLKG